MEEGFSEIQAEEFEAGIRKWRESMSTSPSGRHLGTYKCFVRQGKQKEEKEQILRTLTGAINTAFKKGHSVRRWCKVHNIMLKKDQNDPKPHRVRVIHIIEADYNMTTKV